MAISCRSSDARNLYFLCMLVQIYSVHCWARRSVTRAGTGLSCKTSNSRERVVQVNLCNSYVSHCSVASKFEVFCRKVSFVEERRVEVAGGTSTTSTSGPQCIVYLPFVISLIPFLRRRVNVEQTLEG